MAKSNDQHEFIERLLVQDEPISEDKLSDYRRRLETRLRRSERNTRLAKIVFLAIALLPVVVAGLAALASLSESFSEKTIGGIGPLEALIVGLFYSCFLLVPLSIIYWFTFRRVADRVREDARDAVLVELQQRVAELSQRLGESGE